MNHTTNHRLEQRNGQHLADHLIQVHRRILQGQRALAVLSSFRFDYNLKCMVLVKKGKKSPLAHTDALQLEEISWSKGIVP